MLFYSWWCHTWSDWGSQWYVGTYGIMVLHVFSLVPFLHIHQPLFQSWPIYINLFMFGFREMIWLHQGAFLLEKFRKMVNSLKLMNYRNPYIWTAELIELSGIRFSRPNRVIEWPPLWRPLWPSSYSLILDKVAVIVFFRFLSFQDIRAHTCGSAYVLMLVLCAMSSLKACFQYIRF